jgi:RNA polymerase sigma factor (sigma-70 family)
MELEASAVGSPLGQPATADAIDALFRSERLRLTRLATAITLDRWIAEDVVQDAFAGLGRQASTVTNPAAYLHRSVVNLSIRVTRRRATVARQPRGVESVTNLPELDETWDAVSKLPVRQRAVVALRYWSDMSETEIANALDWPPGTVKSTLHRALKQLKKELAP